MKITTKIMISVAILSIICAWHVLTRRNDVPLCMNKTNDNAGSLRISYNFIEIYAKS